VETCLCPRRRHAGLACGARVHPRRRRLALAGDARWLAGGLILLAAWPYTLLVIMPTNRSLKALSPGEAGPASRALPRRWGNLHAVRMALGVASTAVFIGTALM
jgi:hypothetical protein